MNAGQDEFPKYLMKVDGQRRFYPLHTAGRLFDSGFARVEIGRHVLLEDFAVRTMTDRDRAEISRLADAHSESK